MSFPTFRRARADTFAARMQRARREGYARGANEAELFKRAVGKVIFERQQAIDWLNNAIDDGRAELESQHAWEREIEAWDMSYRIAFLVAIVRAPKAYWGAVFWNVAD
jgi:hypothetical protein